ncbi:uncharacterized protein LDX57_011039 [Aspergillus melleus]|uniref:uncharacterized protein n=1 Tax=Aspergillus melleus TaxID=138277 RepID=UPI001E8E7477|nr:uncharacterized protein LDX57_011039 [Aspergillus melleus]KAH8433405.1 hypothetical protein LDX57_011039 [Aspergillus melleus]
MADSRYTQLGSAESSQELPLNKPSRWNGAWKYLLLALGGLLYIYPFIFTAKHAFSERAPKEYAQVNTFRTVWKPFTWNTEYSPQNHSEADPLWAAINPAHGIISVDREWAEENHWPNSMPMPDDDKKSVYLLEAYHQLHCLQMIRLTFWEAVEGRPYTHQPSNHMEHCFDYLRQIVQCNADNTPLYTFGEFQAGDGQLHRCRDWGELHDYATDHSACYRDSVHGIPLKDHFGFCDSAKVDGLERTLDG